MKRVAIVNGRAAQRWSRQAQALKAQMIAQGIEWRETGADVDSASKLAAQCQNEGVDHLVVVGGDGTIHQVINGLTFQDGDIPKISLLPFGTGSDFARTIRVQFGLRPLSQILENPRLEKLDLARMTNTSGLSRWVVNVASVGLTADVARFVARHGMFKSVLGAASYLAAAFIEIPKFQPSRMKVTLDGAEFFEGDVMFVAIANGRYFGGAVNISPRSSVKDGELDVIVVKRLPKLALAMKSIGYRQGWHLNYSEVRVGKATSISIERNRADAFECDGEIELDLITNIDLIPAVLPMWL